MMETMGAAAAGWQWDETLYAGAAPYYGVGRMPYPGEVANALRSELGLDGTGRLLDVGCGPGPLTLLLAPLFGSATGVDGSAGMIAAARGPGGRGSRMSTGCSCARRTSRPASGDSASSRSRSRFTGSTGRG